MSNCNGNISAQVRELKLKAQVTKLESRIASLEECLAETQSTANQLHRENLELVAQNNFLKGRIDAYECVLAHMIHNDSGVADDCECGCGMCSEG